MKSRPGYTIVEIMVAVAIIALIAVISIPAYQRARITSNDKLVQEDLQALASAAHNYVTINQRSPTMESLTSSPYPYIDQSWNSEVVIKHGHEINLSPSITGGYYICAHAIPGESEYDFCLSDSEALWSRQSTFSHYYIRVHNLGMEMAGPPSFDLSIETHEVTAENGEEPPVEEANNENAAQTQQPTEQLVWRRSRSDESRRPLSN